MLDGLVDAGAPGALARFRDGQRAWDGGSGVAELGEPSPVEPTGWFRIGSLTKAFTATVVLQLVAEDVLHVDETVEDWLPSLVPRGDQITLNHLLRHTSGLSNYTDDLTDNGAVLHDRFRSWTPQETIEHATVKPALFKPGTSRSYSNTNYILLGLVIERSTGRSYEAEVERRILRPVGMDHTLVPGNDPALPEPHAHGYLMIADEPVDITAFNASHAWAAGGIVSTANDLNLFYAALLAGALLEPAGLRAMKTTVPTTSPDMTAGLGISRVVLPDGVPVWGNGGAFFGYSTWSFHTANADRQLTVSATTARGERPSTLDILTKAFCPADGLHLPPVRPTLTPCQDRPDKSMGRGSMTATPATHNAPELLCSFCGKSQDQVAQLIAGPGPCICDECVHLCNDALAGKRLDGLRSWDDQSTTELVATMVRVASLRQQVDRTVGRIARLLRARGTTWTTIGEALGVTRQSAWERFSGEE